MSNGFIPATMEKIYNLGTDVPPASLGGLSRTNLATLSCAPTLILQTYHSGGKL